MPYLVESFEELREETLRALFEAFPPAAVELGLHEYDGRLPDFSSRGVARWVATAHELAYRLRGFPRGGLNGAERRDQRLLLALLEQSFFTLEVTRSHETNPGFHGFALNPVPYIARDYAPLEQRMAAVVALLRAVPGFLRRTRATLREELPAPFIDLGIMVIQGMEESYSKELPPLAAHIPPELHRSFNRAKGTAIKALVAFRGALVDEYRPRASQDFALGPEAYRHMLRANEGLDVDLAALGEMGRRDLEANREAFLAVARALDPARDPAEVAKAIGSDHPRPEGLLSDTAKLLEEIRQFLIDRRVVGVPSEVRAEVAEMPPFMRGFATAAMNSPGAFEKSEEAYYYVTLPDPSWPPEKQEEWLRQLNYTTLKNISVHEAYPGHYVHFLHLRHRVSGMVPKAVISYAFTEGWAHYCEEMMVEVGFGDGDPRLRLAQLQDALLRDCRFLVSLGMHTRGMTLDEATRFIQSNAYLEELPAQREAFRGTFDPGYLSYTLGKLLIKESRDAYLKSHPKATLGEFHDALLALGAPPVGLLPELLDLKG